MTVHELLLLGDDPRARDRRGDVDVLVGARERAGEAVEARRGAGFLEIASQEGPAREIFSAGPEAREDPGATPRLAPRRRTGGEREAVLRVEGGARGSRWTGGKEGLLERGQERGQVAVEVRLEAVAGRLELEDGEIVHVERAWPGEPFEVRGARHEAAQDLLRRAVADLRQRGPNAVRQRRILGEARETQRPLRADENDVPRGTVPPDHEERRLRKVPAEGPGEEADVLHAHVVVVEPLTEDAAGAELLLDVGEELVREERRHARHPGIRGLADDEVVGLLGPEAEEVAPVVQPQGDPWIREEPVVDVREVGPRGLSDLGRDLGGVDRLDREPPERGDRRPRADADDERLLGTRVEERGHAREEPLRHHVFGDVRGVGLAVDVERAQPAAELADRNSRLRPLLQVRDAVLRDGAPEYAALVFVQEGQRVLGVLGVREGPVPSWQDEQ